MELQLMDVQTVLFSTSTWSVQIKIQSCEKMKADTYFFEFLEFSLITIQYCRKWNVHSNPSFTKAPQEKLFALSLNDDDDEGNIFNELKFCSKVDFTRKIEYYILSHPVKSTNFQNFNSIQQSLSL